MATAKKLPSGNYRVLIYTGTVDGKRQYKSFTHEDKREAEFMATSWLREKDAQSRPENMTVGEAIDKYTESKDAVLSPASVRTYKGIRKNCLQGLMNVPLSALTPEMIQRQVNIDAATKSPKTVRSAHGLLISALKVYHKGFTAETTLPQKAKTKIYVPSDDEIKTLLAVAQGTELEIPIVLAIYLGMRRSEICALTCGDIDFKGKKLSVSKAMVLGTESKWHIKAPKSYAGYRVLPLSKYVLEVLEPHRDRDTKERLVQLHPNIITERFENLLVRTFGAIRFRFHDLRHYNASVMLAQNVPNRYAQERLGHATDNMLKSVYQHVFESKQKEISDNLNDYFDSVMQHEMQHESKKL